MASSAKVFTGSLFIFTLLLIGAGCSKSQLRSTDQGSLPAPTTTFMMNEGAQAEGTMADKASDTERMKELNTSTDESAAMQTSTVAMKESSTVMEKHGSYEDFSSDKLALAAHDHVILFFKASWCPTCRAVDTDITAHLNDIPADVHILKVDYDASQELKVKYGVTVQHTFVEVDDHGTLKKKWIGSPTLHDLLEHL